MKNILYYLWKGIFIIVTICLIPIVGLFVKDSYEKVSYSVENFCVVTIVMVIIIGLIILTGYYFNQLIEIFNPKNEK